MVDALNSMAGSRQAQAASHPVTLAQSCSRKAVAEAVAHAGPLPRVNVDTNDPIFVRGFDIQVAFYS